MYRLDADYGSQRVIATKTCCKRKFPQLSFVSRTSFAKPALLFCLHLQVESSSSTSSSRSKVARRVETISLSAQSLILCVDLGLYNNFTPQQSPILLTVSLDSVLEQSAEREIVQSRIDHYQTPSQVHVSVYAKQVDKATSSIKIEEQAVSYQFSVVVQVPS